MARPRRITGQTADEWNDATRREFALVSSMAVAGSPRSTGGGSAAHPLHLPSIVARHPNLLSPYLAWAKAIALGGVLSPWDHELLALRTALLCRSAFEWGVHAETAVGRAALAWAEIGRIAVGANASGWSSHEASLLRAADDLHREQAVSDDTWSELSRDHDDAGLIEIVLVVGQYTMLSMLANSAGIAPEPYWDPLPDSDRV